jgi:hypothetical protein
VVGGVENPVEDVVRHRSGQEMGADVATLIDGAIDAAALGI